MEQIVRQRKRGVVFPVHVVPRSARTEITGMHGGALKVRLTASPVKGAANKALIRFLAQTLAIPKRRIEIISGYTSRNKGIAVSGVSRDAVAAILNAILTENRKSHSHEDKR